MVIAFALEKYAVHICTPKERHDFSVVVSVTGSSLAIDPQCPNNEVRWSLESPFANLARCSPFSMGRRWITDAKERNRFTNGRVATSRLPMNSRSSLGHTCFTQHAPYCKAIKYFVEDTTVKELNGCMSCHFGASIDTPSWVACFSQ